MLRDYPTLYRENNGLALLWLTPWDGQTELSLETLDPYFIEVCRRIRLSTGITGPVAHAAPSKTTRIHSKGLKGFLGDLWTPLRLGAETVSLTITGKGFGYQLISELLLGSEKYRSSPAQESGFDPATNHSEFFARALARGQGITEGYHERRLPLSPVVRATLNQAQGRASLAAIARERVEQSGRMAKKVLIPALLTMIQRSPEKLNFKDRRVDTWHRRFDQKVDAVFFPSLWESLQQDPQQAATNWIHLLAGFGKELLAAAEGGLIAGGARRHKIAVTAERVFRGALYNQFSDHFIRE
ncbi:MAG: CRISPR-associated protein, Cse1 family [Magnetococcales bacterium]|nr:CRISPR-associated protein, Cse1 family [Magnetococcales bacterium]